MKLCTGAQWLLACTGKTGLTWPYGNSYQPDACNTESGKVRRIRAGTPCVSRFGVYDMSGNVAEWTRDRLSRSQGKATVRGGHMNSGSPGSAEGAACSSHKAYPRALVHHTIGFRCCREFDVK
jgi:formylglycine-generating enzyme required for sulfatase activity